MYIDADSMVYAAGFASQWTEYNVKGTRIKLAEDAHEYASVMGFSPDSVEAIKVHGSEDFACGILKDFLTGIGATPGRDRVFLTGAGNFREQRATIKPYKGNRVQDKPYWYSVLRDYLIREWGAEVVHGMEADDAIAIAQTAAPDVVVSIDKDLLQLPGEHLNWRTKEKRVVTQHEADLNLYTQALMGDPTDNIPGLYQMTGQKATAKIKAGLAECSTAEEMYNYVLSVYREAHLNTGILPDDTSIPVNWVNEIMSLLYLLRCEDDKWEAPCA